MKDITDNLDTRAIQAQKAFCVERGARYVPAPAESKLGYALKTKGKLPLNGLRHPAQGDTCGWYIWCGEEYSGARDFFEPLHVQHIYEEEPSLTRLLGLPPGYRFLLHGDYLDVWYDASLLDV